MGAGALRGRKYTAIADAGPQCQLCGRPLKQWRSSRNKNDRWIASSTRCLRCRVSGVRQKPPKLSADGIAKPCSTCHRPTTRRSSVTGQPYCAACFLAEPSHHGEQQREDSDLTASWMVSTTREVSKPVTEMTDETSDFEQTWPLRHSHEDFMKQPVSQMSISAPITIGGVASASASKGTRIKFARLAEERDAEDMEAELLQANQSTPGNSFQNRRRSDGDVVSVSSKSALEPGKQRRRSDGTNVDLTTSSASLWQMRKRTDDSTPKAVPAASAPLGQYKRRTDSELSASASPQEVNLRRRSDGDNPSSIQAKSVPVTHFRRRSDGDRTTDSTPLAGGITPQRKRTRPVIADADTPHGRETGAGSLPVSDYRTASKSSEVARRSSDGSASSSRQLGTKSTKSTPRRDSKNQPPPRNDEALTGADPDFGMQRVRSTSLPALSESRNKLPKSSSQKGTHAAKRMHGDVWVALPIRPRASCALWAGSWGAS
mmetsp:Transcript_63221/g.150783  ORF Transcript_63221/g.150783 Transcript_63221/m.150783 type:complete len:488 (-) Transcript_63221:144-1607(-)